LSRNSSRLTLAESGRRRRRILRARDRATPDARARRSRVVDAHRARAPRVSERRGDADNARDGRTRRDTRMTSALARATLARAAGSRAHGAAKKRSPGSTHKPSQRYAREHPETRVERRAAITEVVRKARGGGAATAARRDARANAAKSRAATASAGMRDYENAEIAPALPLVEVLEPETNRRLLCTLRRRFTLASGSERCLVLPVDTPIDVLRGEGLDESEDLSDIGDDELLQILPDMNRALAMRGFLLQRSAFCMTVRGPVRMNEDDALEMDTGGDEPNEGVEVCTFTSGTSRYLVYAPLNPVLLITNEDPETRLHEVCFDDADVDEATLQANLDAEYEMLSEPEDELFADVAD
jgi:hypothetical protein